MKLEKSIKIKKLANNVPNMTIQDKKSVARNVPPASNVILIGSLK